jgi:hypothetical protein
VAEGTSITPTPPGFKKIAQAFACCRLEPSPPTRVEEIRQSHGVSETLRMQTQVRCEANKRLVFSAQKVLYGLPFLSDIVSAFALEEQRS